MIQRNLDNTRQLKTRFIECGPLMHDHNPFCQINFWKTCDRSIDHTKVAPTDDKEVLAVCQKSDTLLALIEKRLAENICVLDLP